MFNFLRGKLKGILSKKSEETPKEKKSKKAILQKITQKEVSEADVESVFAEIENAFLQNSVALEVVDKVKGDLKSEFAGKKISRIRLNKVLGAQIRASISSILLEPKAGEFLKKIKLHKPCVILFVGVNGSGKTTTIAKMVDYFKRKKLSCVIAAGDTFRAASIEQLEVHAERLGVKVVKHQYGADSTAVAFDAVQHAKAKGIGVVLIDTAGRQHSNMNLMDELKKIKRVVQPDITIFVGDSLTGNDAVMQAVEFGSVVNFDYSILTKADVDEKGGAILSIAYITKKPILFLGSGQAYKDFEEFDKKRVLEKLFK